MKWICHDVKLWLSALLICSGSLVCAERPNVLLILTDDQGYGDLSLHGHPVLETPNIDRLGEQSVRFDRFHAAAVCAPTRASLLTGRNHYETGVWGVHLGQDYMNLDETTLADVLRDAGYDTGMVGKWHSGRAGAWLPWNRGFNDAWMSELYWHENTLISHNGKRLKTSGYAAQCLTDIAIDFIKRDRAENQPFFLYMSYMSAHSPWVTPPEYVRKYKDKGCSDRFALLNGMIEHLDVQIGRLLNGLDESGHTKDTVVIFMTDNGPNKDCPKAGVLTGDEMRARSAGMRGQKGNIWENGTRVPLFIRWSGKTKPSVVHALTDVTDIFPTLLELLRIDAPESGYPIHGESLIPFLAGRKSDWKEPRQLFKPHWYPFKDDGWSRNGALDPADVEYDNQINSLYDGFYKAVKYRNKPLELYELSADPGEKKDIASEYPEMVAAMGGKMQEAYDEMVATGRCYRQPRFHIGHPVYDAYDTVGEMLAGSHIPFCSSVRDEGSVISMNYFSKGWKTPGDAQNILVDVVTPGQYNVILEAKKFRKGTRVRLEVGSSVLETVLPEGQGKVSVGGIKLGKGEQNLRFSLLSVPPTDGAAIEQMKLAVFEKAE